MPRPNGYQSLHTSVIGDEGHPFEVQIRTPEMHRIAEEGIAAHWKYKEGRTGVDKDDQAFAWLRQLLEWQQEVKDPHEFLNSLKLDLYPEEVYCFTPKGEVKTLPRGASADRLRLRHPHRGRPPVRGRARQRQDGAAALQAEERRHRRDPDLARPQPEPRLAEPSPSPTRRAAKIRHYLNTAEKQQALEIGRKHFERELKRYDLSLKKCSRSRRRSRRWPRSWASGTRLDDLFAAVGYGKVSMRQVLAQAAAAREARRRRRPSKPRPIADAVKRLLRVGDDRIKVKGTDDLLIYRAKCCNPIMGEPIVGYITRGKGVSVHSPDLPERDEPDVRPRAAHRGRVGAGGRGRPTRCASRSGGGPARACSPPSPPRSPPSSTDIRDAQARTFDDRTASIELTLRIQDLKHLEQVVKSIRGVSGRDRRGAPEPSPR